MKKCKYAYHIFDRRKIEILSSKEWNGVDILSGSKLRDVDQGRNDAFLG